MVAKAVMDRRPDEQSVVEILKRWKVTYAVLDTRKGVMSLDGAIEDFLRVRTIPVLISDKIVVYKVPSLTAGTVTSQIGKATSSAVTANNPPKTVGDGED